MTIERVAQHLKCSVSKLSRIEKGQVSARQQDVEDLLTLYGVNDLKREELLQLARQARRRTWWEVEYHDLPLAYASYEAAAAVISMYQALVVPGLLQTEEYARAVLRSLRPGLSPPDVDGRIDFRVRQQSLLTRPDPTELKVVLDEAVVRRPVGSAAVMRQQLERLLEWTERPNVALQVLPFAAGEHAGMDGPFVIFGFGTPGEDAVYLEHTTNDFLLEEGDAVARYRVLFGHLSQQALDTKESRRFISNASKDL